MAVYGFGSFTLDEDERRVLHGTKALDISGKTFDVLNVLVEAKGRLVHREALFAKLWPDVTVEERNLTVRISTLRKALAARDRRDLIETVPKIGYRIKVPVELLTSADEPQPSSPPAPLAPPSPFSPELERLTREARELLEQAERMPVLKALGLFERVLASRPGDARAHAGLSSTYFMLASTNIRRPLPVEEAIQLAREAAERSLALDSGNGEARSILGLIFMIYDRNWDRAGEALSRAVEDDPRSVNGTVAHGMFLSATGQHSLAIARLIQARQLEPSRHTTLEQLGLAYWMSGATNQALTALIEASVIAPAARRPHFRRMVVLDHAGQHESAMAERLQWLRMLGDPESAVRLERVKDSGDRNAAMTDWIAILVRLNQWYEVAIYRMIIGDRSGTLEALRRCIDERNDRVFTVGQYPTFHPLHGDPRFHQILAGVGLVASDRPRLQVVR